MTSPRGYDAGTAILQIIPVFKGVQERIEREVKGVERALGRKSGEEFGKNFEEGTNKAVDRVLGTETAKRAAKKAGQAYAGAFSDHLKKAIGEAQKEIRSTIKLTTDDKDTQRTLRGISNELNKLAKAKIGIDVDAADALARIEAVHQVVKELQRDSAKIDVGVNTATAQVALQRMEKTIRELKNVNIEVELDERKMGLFEKAVKRRLKAAVENIPPVNFDADVSEAVNKVQKLRHEMSTLLDKRVGIDIDGSSLLLQMEKIRTALASVGGDRTLDVQVRTDAASAAKELAQIRALVELVDGSTAKVKVDIDSNTVVSKLEQLRARLIGTDHAGRNAADSFRSFNAVILAGAAILPAVVPALSAAAGAMLLLGPAALAAAAGLGALIFGFSGIGDAVKALGKQQESASRDSLASARTMRDASAAVADAERGLATAREQAGRASAAAARQVEDAIQSQRQAEQDLVRAQGDVVRAQEAVNQAREDARERIEDLSLSIRGGALAEREAVLDLADAQREFNEAQASGAGGTALERLRIDLEQARLRVDQLRESNKDMAQEQAEFNRTGVDGSREVKSAQEQLAIAQQGVADAMARVADASQGVQDALASQAQTNADNSRLIEDAQRSVTEAQQRYNEALSETSTAAEGVSDAFAKLGPAGRRFAIFIDGLRGQMRTLRDELQNGLLPGVEDSISRILSQNGPLLQTFMRNMGNTLGNLFREFGTLMTSPQWQGLWATFNEYAPTFVEQFTHVAFAMLTFFGELFQGLAPYAERFGNALVNLANDSAEWIAAFTNSQTFQDIMDWLFENGPVIFEHLLSIARAAINLLVALEPLGMVILGAIGHIADFLASLDPNVLGAIVTTILGLVVAFQLASGAVALFTGATNVLTGKLSRIVFFFGAAATALTVLYTQSETVREFFDWLFGILGDIVGWFTDLPGPIKETAIALGLLVALRSPLSTLFSTLGGKALGAATTGALTLSSAVGQLGAPGGAMNVARAAGGRLINFLGGPWLVGLAGAVTGLTLLYDWLDTSSEAADNATDYQKRLAAALRESKGAIDDNVRAQAAQALVDAEIGDSNALRVARDLGLELPQVTEALLGNADAYEKIRDRLNSIIDQSLLAENAGDLEWTKKAEDARLLLEVLDALAPSMGIVTENADLLGEATGEAAGAQGRFADAAQRVNTALATQNQHLIDLTEAELSFSQSSQSLADSHTRVAEAQEALNEARASGNAADIAAAERAVADALAGVERQSYDTAIAAGRLAEKRFANAEGEDLQLLRDAAILENLREQERLYGTLPPHLQELKDGLENTVPSAYTAAVQMANLGLAVESIPSDKTIVISGDTPASQLQTLRDLGLEVTELPDGSFAVTANTDEAQTILDNFLAQDLGIEIGASVKWEGTRPFESHSGQGGFNTGGGRAAGGPVWGPGTATSDSIPAWLSNGEYVVKAASVKKYGLGLLNMINAGQYAMGGLVKAGRRKFAEGGLAATWGGTMTLTGGDTNPLAQIWFEAIRAINAAAAAGAAVISAQFVRMRDRVLGTIRDLRARSMAEFAPMVLGLVRQATSMRTLVDQQVLTMSLNAVRTFTGMRTTLTRTVLDMSLGIVRTFTGMRTAVDATVNAMIGAVGTHFARLPRSTATPVNAVIDRVLNRGLFRAFNMIVTELGLNKEWTISAAPGVQLAATGGGARLATGGRVPGHSPNDTADNIPAWLTAGEWVHPVDAVRYYGSDLMEKIRRRKIPREQLAYFADGGGVQRRATGGEIYAKTLSVFPRAKLNSSYRPGDPGYHGRNMAADLGEAGFAGGIGRAYIAAMKRWWVDNFGRTANEIIYNGLGNDRTNINNGAPYAYSAATQAEHRNHLHVAYAAGLAGFTGAPSGIAGLGAGFMVEPPAWYKKYGSAGGVLKHLESSIKAVDELTGYGKPGKMYKGLADKAVDYVWSKAESAIEGLFAGMAGQLQGAVVGASGASGPIVDIVRSVASKYGWGEGNEWNALSQLIQKESSWNPNAQNPTSTAYGLFQFLNGTWAGVNATKTSDPGLQTVAGLRYIQGRYGSPSQALAFHLANNWYSQGGEVTDGNADAPTLYDTGGWLPPGLTTVLNATNKPEPILTSEQWADLTRSRGDSAPGNVIGALHLHQVQSDLEDAVAEVNHWATVYDKQGGRYAATGGRG